MKRKSASSSKKDDNAYTSIHLRFQVRLSGDRTYKDAPQSTRFSNISEKGSLYKSIPKITFTTKKTK